MVGSQHGSDLEGNTNIGRAYMSLQLGAQGCHKKITPCSRPHTRDLLGRGGAKWLPLSRNGGGYKAGHDGRLMGVGGMEQVRRET